LDAAARLTDFYRERVASSSSRIHRPSHRRKRWTRVRVADDESSGVEGGRFIDPARAHRARVRTRCSPGS